MNTQLANVVEVVSGAVYVEIPALGAGKAIGPCLCLYVAPEVGDRVAVAPLGGDGDAWMVCGPA